MPCEHTHGSDTSGTMVAGMTSVRAVEQTRMGIAALLVSNIGWGVLPLYWHALSGMNAISVLAYRLIATLVVMIALLMAFRRYRAYHRAIAALWCAQRSKRLFALELAATTAISVNWLLYIYLVVNGQALQTSIAYLTTPLLNVALGVGMFTAQSPTFPWMAIVLATSFSAYGLLKRYVPLDAAQAENDKDMRQWEPLNSMLLISSTLAFARYDDKRMWAYDVIENAMTRNLGYSFSEEYDESAEDNEDTNEVGGQPGPRLNYGPTYYAAFVHDPEGNNIEVMLA